MQYIERNSRATGWKKSKFKVKKLQLVSILVTASIETNLTSQQRTIRNMRKIRLMEQKNQEAKEHQPPNSNLFACLPKQIRRVYITFIQNLIAKL